MPSLLTWKVMTPELPYFAGQATAAKPRVNRSFLSR